MEGKVNGIFAPIVQPLIRHADYLFTPSITMTSKGCSVMSIS